MIGKVLSNFRITDKLGEGGMGVVYRAEDTRLGREVAIKVLPAAVADDPERLARFQREARVLASLNHPNIASIHDVQEVDGQQLLILELVEGLTLGERIRQGALPQGEALGIARQIAEALENAHEKGVIHRDLKPANVKITPDGQVKVLDFGLAKAFDTEGGPGGDPRVSQSPTMSAQMTGAGMLLGTAAYMSPEQARGHAADKRADVWAFGCVLYELLTGRQPFQEDTISDTLAAVLKSDVAFDTLPVETPERVRRIVRRCLDKDSKQRLRDIGEARIALEKAEADPDEAPTLVGEVAPTTTVGPVTSGKPSRLAWLLAGASTIAALALAFLLVTRTSPETPVIRGSLTLVGDSRLQLDSSAPGLPAVSPSGDRVVFTVTAEDGVSRLWIRDLDDSMPRPIAGTDAAAYPFWSPDGRHIAFFAQGKLKKVEATGGAVLTLCDALNGKGGSWNASGDVIFSGGPRSPLFRVSSVGGEPTAITALEDTPSADSHRHPRFLPDGKHFVYLVRDAPGGDSEKNQIYLGSLDGGEDRPLFVSDSQAEYVAGHLLHTREGALLAQPFDTQRFETTGERFPVVDRITFLQAASAGVFSASEDLLVFLVGTIERESSRLAWVDRAGEDLDVLAESEPSGQVAISPDGRSVISSVDDAEGGTGVWIWNLERKLRSRLTLTGGNHFAPVWSPDGRRVAYSRSRSGGEFDLFAIEVGGSGQEQLLYESDQPKFATSWTPDGQSLLYSAFTGTSADLFRLDVSSGEVSELLAAEGYDLNYPAISPDGRWLIYASDESGRNEIYLTAYPTGGPRWQVSTSGGQHPRWRRDGREIFYVNPEDEMLNAVAIDLASGSSPTIGRPEVLFSVPDAFLGLKYDVGPKGESFLVLQPGDAAAAAPLTMVYNWAAELAER